MGCCSSKVGANADDEPFTQNLDLVPPDEKLDANAAMAASLLGILLRDTSTPDLPVKDHKARIPSGERGVSLAFLRGARKFFGEHGMLNETMEFVCKKKGSKTSVCAITRSTGLSLAESIAIAAADMAVEGASAETEMLVGKAEETGQVRRGGEVLGRERGVGCGVR